MKTILVKYLPATNRLGARLKATDTDRNSLIVSKHYELDGTDEARRVALMFIDKMGWNVEITGDGFLQQYGHVFTIKTVRKEAT